MYLQISYGRNFTLVKWNQPVLLKIDLSYIFTLLVSNFVLSLLFVLLWYWYYVTFGQVMIAKSINKCSQWLSRLQTLVVFILDLGTEFITDLQGVFLTVLQFPPLKDVAATILIKLLLKVALINKQLVIILMTFFYESLW